MSYYMNMSESSGSHGMFGRIAEERYKQEKKKNDDADKRNEKIQAQYKRAGYEDKIPEDKKKADRSLENSYKNTAVVDKELRSSSKLGHVDRKRYANGSVGYKKTTHNNDAAYRIARDYIDHKGRNELNDRQKALHDRINSRAKHECGIFSECSFI